jgi:5-methylcytosine-specific restriction endonuclease McrA
MAIVYNSDGAAGKVCNKCGEWKPVSEFSRQTANLKKGGDGFHYTCKLCHNALRRSQLDQIREDFNAQRREYYRRNRDRMIAAVRAYRESYPERVKDSQRAYYERNREQRQQAQRVRNARQRAAQGEQVRAYHRAYYRKLKQSDYEKLRRWQRNHELRRRNRKNHTEGSHTEAEWEALKAYYNYTCLRCGKREPEVSLTRDHVVPLSQGGSDWITNLQPLCPICNSTKNDKMIDYRAYWPLASDISSETLEDQ